MRYEAINELKQVISLIPIENRPEAIHLIDCIDSFFSLYLKSGKQCFKVIINEYISQVNLMAGIR
jgi:hypothetical protein